MKEIKKNFRISKRLDNALTNYFKDKPVSFSEAMRNYCRKLVNLKEDKK